MTKRIVVAVAVVSTSLWFGAQPAFAHTEFEASNPVDGAIIDQPVGQIEIVFSGEAEPFGGGFVVMDASGVTREPAVASADNRTWVLSFDAPLPEGATGVRWSVAAPDAHPIEGSFSFTIAGTNDSAVSSPAPGDDAVAADIDAFLDASDPQPPLVGPVGVAARSLSLLGAMLAMGGIVFAALVLRGSQRDIRSVLFWVRRAAVILGLGAVLELVGQLAVTNGHWLTVWPLSSIIEVVWAPLGGAIVLRLVGGALMLRAHLDVVSASETADPVVAVQSAVSLGAGRSGGAHLGRRSNQVVVGAEPYVHDGDQAWRVDGDLLLVGVGVVSTLLSFVFDGHTVSEGSRLFTALVDMVHVGAAAVWAGGLVMLVHVVWLRHRRGTDVRALQLAVRFSVVAAAALVAAGTAGAILAAIILDSLPELWATPWGRVLLAKVAVVAVAAAAGGYNHKVLIPRMMRRAPNDPEADAEFRRTVSVEGAAMLLVIVLTAILVGAAS